MNVLMKNLGVNKLILISKNTYLITRFLIMRRISFKLQNLLTKRISNKNSKFSSKKNMKLKF